MSGYIDESRWPRKPLSDAFGQLDYPFYSLTCRIEAGPLYARAKREGVSFYLCTVFAMTAACNATDAFLYKLRQDGVYRHDYLSPSFTDAAQDGLFKIVTADWQPGETMIDFARRTRALSDAQTALLPSDESEARDDLIYLSCLPWLDFTSLSNERSLDRLDSVPRIGFGKLTKTESGASMPVSVDVNHRLIDGAHIGAFFEALAAFTTR